MTEIERVIKTVADGLKAIAQGVEKLAEKVDDIGKSVSEEKPKAKRKAPAKPKKTAAKKPVQKSASDTVLGVIKRSKKGVNTAIIMEKTGYERKKVSNIVHRLKKQGKIKSAGRGIYIKA